MRDVVLAIAAGIPLALSGQPPRATAILPGYRTPVWLDTTGQVRHFAVTPQRALDAVDSVVSLLVQPPGAADSAAFAALSDSERRFLDIRTQLADTGLSCVQQGTTSSGESRRRLQGHLRDGSSLVVFARVRERTGEVRRVEFVRTRNGVQRGMTWDADGNTTTGVDWNAKRTRATPYPIPSGGPLPQVLRGLARRVVARCG